MPAPRKMSDDFLAECDAEARRRAQRVSNKELARKGGVTTSYISQVIARLVRKYQRSSVSRGTG